jgi:DnaK suppressor protein
MPDANTYLDQEFVRNQRERLERLRAQLLGAEAKISAAERSSRDQLGSEPQDEEDRAELAIEDESRHELSYADEQRLRHVERALRKIDDGTYGLSDLSGSRIPKPRLEAVPEAILTVEEEREAEKKRAQE